MAFNFVLLGEDRFVLLACRRSERHSLPHLFGKPGCIAPKSSPKISTARNLSPFQSLEAEADDDLEVPRRACRVGFQKGLLRRPEITPLICLCKEGGAVEGAVVEEPKR